MERNAQSKGRLALGIAMASAACSALLNKLALNTGMHPVWVNALRLAFTLVIMLLIGLATRRKKLIEIHWANARLSLLSGVLLAAHLVCWVYALKLTDALAVTTIWSTYVFLTALGSVWILKERIPRMAYLAMLVAVAGVLVCNIGWNASTLSGNLAALGAAFTQAGYMLCGRFVRRKTDTYSYTMVVYSAALLVLLALAALLRLPLTGLSLGSLGSTLALAVFSTLLGHTLCNYALKTLSATTVSTGMLTEVITGPLLVMAVLGDRPSVNTLIGGALILVAVGWYFFLDHRQAAGG